MASSNIKSVSVGLILIQSGNGTPNHISTKGSIYIDLNTANEYINKDGVSTWVEIIDGNYSTLLSQDQYDAISGSSSPSSSNVFATISDITAGAFTGGTVTGPTNFLAGLTSTTISATTYIGLPSDIYTTGGTYSDSTGITTFNNSTGGTFNVSGYFKTSDDIYTTGLTLNIGTYDLSAVRNDGTIITTNLGLLASDISITGGSYNNNTGVVTFINNTGGTFNVSGFTTGMTDTTISSYTYDNANKFTINDSTGGTFTAVINTMTGLTINGVLSATTISGGTLYGDGSNLTGISTANNFVTGGTVSGTDLLLNRNDDVTVTIDTSDYFDSKWVQSGSSIYNLNDNVGIGTNDPQFTLDVVGSGGTSSFEDIGRFRTIDSTDYLAITNAISTDGSFNPVLRSFNNTNVSTNFYIQSVIDPSVDTGVNPLLMLQGRVSTDPGNVTWSGVTTRPILRVRNNSENLLQVDANGNVGINTITPTEKLDVSGNTIIRGGLSADTISATTYYGISTDNNFVTGATYNNANTFTFTNNTGGTFNTSFNTITGLTVNGSVTVTGTSFAGLVSGTVGAIGTLSTTNHSTTSLTVNGNATITGSVRSDIFTGRTGPAVYYGNGSNLTGISTANTFVTGGTPNNTSRLYTFTNNTGGTFNVTALTDIRVTGGTFSSGTAVFTNNTGGTFSVSGFSTGGVFTGGTVTGATIFTGGLTANTFNISTTPQSATTTSDVILTRSTGGTVTYITQIDGYISSGSTTGNLLSATSGWTINGSYTGTAITGTYQGQNYYDDNYFYTAVNDNLWIRLIRG